MDGDGDGSKHEAMDGDSDGDEHETRSDERRRRRIVTECDLELVVTSLCETKKNKMKHKHTSENVQR